MPPKKQPATAADDSIYYDSTDIDALEAMYNLIIGQRSNGKTFKMCRKILTAYIDEGLPSSYIRRWKEEITGALIEILFNPHNEWLKEYTKNKYNGIRYYRKAWYLAHYETTKTGETVRTASDSKPFCRCYAVSTAESTKGADPGAQKYIVFDEFITRRFYINNEFVHFQNLLSSIIRDRSGVKIYMLANTVNKFCPYFAEMGISDVQDMQPGTINFYSDEQQKRPSIAVEYCAASANTKKVSKYFNFANPQLNMITSGAWEIASYRHAPDDIDDYDILIPFFILFAGKIIQGDIYNYKDYPVIFYHLKTTPLQHPNKDIIYSEVVIDGNPLHMCSISGGRTKAQKLIEQLIKTNRTFYADNNVGELVNNWLKDSMTPKIIKA